HLQRALDILASFAGVAELQEEANLDAHALQPPRRFVDLLDLSALLHRIEDCLRARLGAYPNPLRPSPRQRRHGVTLQDEVHSLQTLEWHARVEPFDLVRELLDPTGFETENVVGKPDV